MIDFSHSGKQFKVCRFDFRNQSPVLLFKYCSCCSRTLWTDCNMMKGSTRDRVVGELLYARQVRWNRNYLSAAPPSRHPPVKPQIVSLVPLSCQNPPVLFCDCVTLWPRAPPLTPSVSLWFLIIPSPRPSRLFYLFIYLLLSNNIKLQIGTKSFLQLVCSVFFLSLSFCRAHFLA